MSTKGMKYEKPLSLYGLNLDDVVRACLNTPPSPRVRNETHRQLWARMRARFPDHAPADIRRMVDAIFAEQDGDSRKGVREKRRRTQC